MRMPDFKKTPIVIICRDRLTPLQQLLARLDAAGYVRPVLVDNASTYPPLVDFLDRLTDIEVFRLTENLAHKAPWQADAVQAKLRTTFPVVVTDCDVVPDDDCPSDLVEHLATVLLRYADVDKVGLGLRIDDLPASYEKRDTVIAWESQFWKKEIAPGIFSAWVDTTFALYRSLQPPHGVKRALRTGPPYLARHLPWYADSARPTEEQRYYEANAETDLLHW